MKSEMAGTNGQQRIKVFQFDAGRLHINTFGNCTHYGIGTRSDRFKVV
jgi:hypothetical protein